MAALTPSSFNVFSSSFILRLKWVNLELWHYWPAASSPACVNIIRSSTCSHAQCRYDYVTATADCTSLNLDCIPANYPDALIMDLRHNNISGLASDDFDDKFKRLEELYLDYNNISNVTSLLGSHELSSLLKLSVKHNIISDLPLDCQLGSLTSLSVDYNNHNNRCSELQCFGKFLRWL